MEGGGRRIDVALAVIFLQFLYCRVVKNRGVNFCYPSPSIRVLHAYETEGLG